MESHSRTTDADMPELLAQGSPSLAMNRHAPQVPSAKAHVLVCTGCRRCTCKGRRRLGRGAAGRRNQPWQIACRRSDRCTGNIRRHQQVMQAVPWFGPRVVHTGPHARDHRSRRCRGLLSSQEPSVVIRHASAVIVALSQRHSRRPCHGGIERILTLVAARVRCR